MRIDLDRAHDETTLNRGEAVKDQRIRTMQWKRAAKRGQLRHLTNTNQHDRGGSARDDRDRDAQASLGT